MIQNIRSLTVHLCNLDNENIALLYDSTSDFTGSIHNIVISSSRNSPKSLSFTVDNGDENTNWLAEMMLPEYRIHTIENGVEDYYLFTKDSIQHSNNSRSVQVTCPHISCLLKFKAMDLEFSDDYGNNVGTMNALATTILAETDWTYDADGSAKFYEKDGVTEKNRTLTASAKTGAYSLLTRAADLFDAKLVFDGANKKVRAIPMNPFSVDKDTGLPDFKYASNSIEVNYGVNMKNITRSRDSENIATSLYCYGAYGDTTSKYCGIEDIEFKRYTYTCNGSETGTLYFIINEYINGSTHYVYFLSDALSAGDVLEYYALDYASDLYVWNKTRLKAIPTCEAAAGTELTMTEETLNRNHSTIMDFDYYAENGLLTEAQIQAIANYQVGCWSILKDIRDLTDIYNDDYSALSESISINNYCKIAVKSVSNVDDCLKLTLDLTNYPDNGIIYHSQEDTLVRKSWFEWRVATQVDENGDAINSDASVIYLCNSTNGNLTRSYIKTINKTDDVATSLVLWLPYSARLLGNVHYYLFGANTVAGYLGNCETNIESKRLALKEQTTWKGIYHPVYYTSTKETAPTVPTDLEWAWNVLYTAETYATWELYFYCSHYGDTGWLPCAYSATTPSTSSYNYWYDYSHGCHYRLVNGSWVLLYDNKSTDYTTKTRNKQIAGMMTNVWDTIHGLRRIYVGTYTQYNWTVSSAVAAGKYFRRIGDKNYLFSLDYALAANDVLVCDTTKGQVFKKDYFDSTTVSYKAFEDSSTSITHYPANELSATSWHIGTIDDSGEPETQTGSVYSGVVSVREKTPYSITHDKEVVCFYYTDGNVFISKATIPVGTTRFTTPEDCRKLKVSMVGSSTEADSIVITRYNNTNNKYIVYQDEEWTQLSATEDTTGSTLIGFLTQTKNFITYSDKIYLVDKVNIKTKQNQKKQLLNAMATALGSMYRESWKQDNSYVEGDEQKLFDDSLEDVETLAYPTTTYQIGYLDRYGTDVGEPGEWEDITVDTAVYLNDDELDVHQWAFVDSIKVCYDVPQSTSITINTALTKLSQQSFTDVLSNIAKVAQETQASETIYERAEALTGAGTLAAQKLEGELYAQTVKMLGGSSAWETDAAGNIVFTAADGSSAMMLTGYGLVVADTKDKYGKWIWRTAITAGSINADLINTGTLNASVITAGSITADKLESSVGESLDISSNKEVLLFSTVDGKRPSGRVEVVKDGGSFISISSTDGIQIASGANVDIASGATVSIEGADVTIDGGDIDMTAGTNLNAAGANINVTASGKLTVDSSEVDINSGTVDLDASSSLTMNGGTTGSSFVLDSTGATVTGLNISLLTNSGTDGKILLGSTNNVMTSSGVLSLHGGDLVIDGVNSTMTATKDFTITSAGNLNLNADTSALNISAGSVNVSGTSAINLTGGALTASGTAIDIQATSSLDVDSPNLKIDSVADTLEVYGTVVAENGKIGATYDSSTGQWTGGWTIDADKIYAGTPSSDNYVELNSASNYAILAGGDSVGGTNPATFAVQRDGTVLINKLIRYKEGTTIPETIDLRASLWKMDSAYSHSIPTASSPYKALDITQDTTTGQYTLTLTDNSGISYSVNFLSGGSIKYIKGTSTLREEGSTTFTTAACAAEGAVVFQQSADTLVIPEITYVDSGEFAGNLLAEANIHFSPTVTPSLVSGYQYTPITLDINSTPPASNAILVDMLLNNNSIDKRTIYSQEDFLENTTTNEIKSACTFFYRDGTVIKQGSYFNCAEVYNILRHVEHTIASESLLLIHKAEVTDIFPTTTTIGIKEDETTITFTDNSVIDSGYAKLNKDAVITSTTGGVSVTISNIVSWWVSDSPNEIIWDKDNLTFKCKQNIYDGHNTSSLILTNSFDIDASLGFEAVSSSLITKQGAEVTPIEVRYATSSGETAGAATNITGTKHSSSSVTPISSSSLTLTKTTLYTGNPEKITPIGDPVTPSTTTAYLRNTSALYFNPVTRYSSTSAGTILTGITAVSNTCYLPSSSGINVKICSTGTILVDPSSKSVTGTKVYPRAGASESEAYTVYDVGSSGTWYNGGTKYSGGYYSSKDSKAYTITTGGTQYYAPSSTQVYYSSTQPYTGTVTTDKYYATDGATYYDKGTSKSTGGYEVYTSAGSATYYDVGSADTLYKADEEITRYTLSSKTAYITDDEGTTYYMPGTAAQYIQYDGDLYEPSSDTYATLPKGYAEKKVYLANDTTNWVCRTTGESVPLYKEGTDATVYETTETLYKAKEST